MNAQIMQTLGYDLNVAPTADITIELQDESRPRLLASWHAESE